MATTYETARELLEPDQRARLDADAVLAADFTQAIADHNNSLKAVGCSWGGMTGPRRFMGSNTLTRIEFDRRLEARRAIMAHSGQLVSEVAQ